MIAKFQIKAYERGTELGLDVDTQRKNAHARLDQFFDKLDTLKKWAVVVNVRHLL